MPRRSLRTKNNDVVSERTQQEQGNSVSQVVRDRQRAVAEREASRLARPERSSQPKLAHVNRKISAVSSTPFGFFCSKNDDDVDDDVDDDQDQWCGPFSVARQMIAKRERLKRKRDEELSEQKQKEHHPLDGLMDEVNYEQQLKKHPSMKWKSSISNNAPASTYAKRQRRVDLIKIGKGRIPKLYEMAVEFLVDNFDRISELGDVDNDVRLALGKELVGRNKLDARNFEILINPADSIETLEIIDASCITQDTMASILARTTSMRHLLLTHAGRCFGSKTVNTLLEKNSGAELCVLSIAGAYLLQDEDASKLIKAHDTTLQSISFQSCSLLGGKCVSAIHDSKNLYGNLMELSFSDMQFSNDHLMILGNSNGIKSLKNLTLKSVMGLTDEILTKILKTINVSVEVLNIGYNYSLTDETLSSIRKCNQNLKTLTLDGNKEFTAAGLEALFTHPLEGLPPPPKLKVLKLASIDHKAVTDDTLRLVTASSSANTRGGGLVELDVQGSTAVTDQMLEQLAESSARTLTNLNVSYCPQISDQGLGFLIGSIDNQLTKLQVWGCAQLTDEFFDGHSRVRDGDLEILGAWMKKSGTSTLR